MRHLAPLALLLLAVPAAAQGPGPLPPVPVPAGNPITLDKGNLGKLLFWEEQLSSARNVACGTCHFPTSGGSDPRSSLTANPHPGADGLFLTADDVAGSPGVIRRRADGLYEPDATFGLRTQITGRKAPSMINAAFAPSLFWDGRASSTFTDPITGAVVLGANAALESQAAAPPVSEAEMGHVGRDWNDVVARLGAVTPLALAESVPPALDAWRAGRTYPELFQAAFGGSEITAARILMAIATYERTLISDQSPFDAFLAGVPGALTPQQQRGRLVFLGPGNCVPCHGGPLQTDQLFHAVGVRPAIEDLGRFEITGLPGDRGHFKTPSLRNVGLRAPYFHNGSKATLEDVVAFYDRGGDFIPNQIAPLGLTAQQQADLVVFLREALTDPRVQAGVAPFDRPVLFSESARRPTPIGAAVPNAAGSLPRMIADEPAKAGNSTLTMGVDGGRGGAIAVLALDRSANPAGLRYLGGRIYLGLTPALQAVHVAPLQGVGQGNGWDSVTTAIPPGLALVGSSVYLQWLVFEQNFGVLSNSVAVEWPAF